MEDYKEEIQNTRVGSLGSSDGKMLQQIGTLGFVPDSAKKRLAICKGLIPHEEIPETEAIRAGNIMEMAIYNHIVATDKRYKSNPLWVSKKFSRKNVRLISHPDIVLEDEKTNTLYVYEIKTTKYSFEATRHNYGAQLYIHSLLAKEHAANLPGRWKVKMFLVIYNTNDLDLSNPVDLEFDINRLVVKEVKVGTNFFDINYAMDIVDKFLEDFNSYYADDEIDSKYLPENVKQEFALITNIITEIKEREKKVEDFKTKLYDFMREKNIKSIKNELWGITRVDECESKSFDGKKFIEDYQKKYPRKVKRLLSEYSKIVKKKGSVRIILKQQ